jgi:hypothetical protein
VTGPQLFTVLFTNQHHATADPDRTSPYGNAQKLVLHNLLSG